MLISIDKILEIGLGLIQTEYSELTLHNRFYSMSYDNNCFFCYSESIGYKSYDTEKEVWSMYVFAKTAKYGDFIDNTTSHNIGKLISAIKKHYHYKNNWYLIDKEGRIITENKDSGKKCIENFNCCICIEDKKRGLRLRCGHIFCSKCIKTWLKSSHSCPYCKQSIYF
jgi:hypothetical protein